MNFQFLVCFFQCFFCHFRLFVQDKQVAEEQQYQQSSFRSGDRSVKGHHVEQYADSEKKEKLVADAFESYMDWKYQGTKAEYESDICNIAADDVSQGYRRRMLNNICEKTDDKLRHRGAISNYCKPDDKRFYPVARCKVAAPFHQPFGSQIQQISTEEQCGDISGKPDKGRVVRNSHTAVTRSGCFIDKAGV